MCNTRKILYLIDCIMGKFLILSILIKLHIKCDPLFIFFLTGSWKKPSLPKLQQRREFCPQTEFWHVPQFSLVPEVLGLLGKRWTALSASPFTELWNEMEKSVPKWEGHWCCITDLKWKLVGHIALFHYSLCLLCSDTCKMVLNGRKTQFHSNWKSQFKCQFLLATDCIVLHGQVPFEEFQLCIHFMCRYFLR